MPAPAAPGSRGPGRFTAALFLGGMTLAAVALILFWGAAEQGPTHWDDSWYLAGAVRLFDRFAQEGVAGYWRGFAHALADKAPLITVLPFPFFCLIGRSVYVIYLVNSAGCVLLSLSLYLFCRKFFNRTVSLLAVFFALASPMLAGLSRLFLPEYWLTAFVALGMLALAEWEASGRLLWLFFFGVICGLGLLMKITFPIFAAPAAAVVLWRKRGSAIGRPLLQLIVLAVPALLLAGPWYWHNWESVTRRSLQETYFMPVHPTEKPSPPAMAVEYFWMVINQGLSSIHVLAALAGLIAWAAARRENFLRGMLRYIVPWLIALPVFALSENRDLRLIAPMFPAFAILTAALFHQLLLRAGALRRPLAALAMAAAVVITLGNSFETFGPRLVRLGPWQVFASAQGYAFAPNPQRWPLSDVLERIARRERLGPGSKLIVGLGADTWSFNSNNLDLQAALLKYPFEFHTTAYTAQTGQIRRIMSQTQYFLLKDGGTQQPMDRFRSGPRTMEFLLKGPLFREVEPSVPTPDGGRIRIFENASAGPDVFLQARRPAALPELDTVDVNFGNQLQITGLQVTEKDGWFTVRLRWRCLNAVRRPYRAFVHVVNAQEKLLGSMDHEILHGSPPVNGWEPGDEGYEARYLVLPAAASRQAHLRLGIFDPETGLRVPVWSSTFPLRDDFTAAVVEPNQAAPAGHAFQMQPAAAVPCNVEFGGGLKLTAYSVARSAGAAWIQLHWTAARKPRAKLRFFGHAVASRERDTPILLSFDQDLILDGETATQDVVRDVSKLGPAAKFIRAGVFDVSRPLDRLAIRASDLPWDRGQKAVYLPLPAPR
jgi:4-amino-4-deoxy-L-arabinose transferase-like glycosyltransferase